MTKTQPQSLGQSAMPASARLGVDAPVVIDEFNAVARGNIGVNVPVHVVDQRRRHGQEVLREEIQDFRNPDSLFLVIDAQVAAFGEELPRQPVQVLIQAGERISTSC